MVKHETILNAEDDLAHVRDDFPIFQHQPDLVFLDSAASAQKPYAVLDAMDHIYHHGYANIHRGLYRISQELTASFEAVRARVAAFIRAPSPESIIFTKNATEGFNLLANCFALENLQEGDEILLTPLEHHANIVPWQIVAQKKGAIIKILPLRDNWQLHVEDVISAVTAKTKIFSLTALSNALGVITPARDLIAAARAANPGIRIFLDATQAVVHGDFDFQAAGCDACVFTGHKFYGPNGVGVLAGKSDFLETLPPYQGGGDMIDKVSFSGTTFKPAPYRFEAGTPAIVPVIGLGAALDYISGITMPRITAYEAHLGTKMTKALSAIKGIEIYAKDAPRAGIISFNIRGIHHSDLATLLDQQGVAVRSGHHCCMPLMEGLGITGSVRASLGIYNHSSDIDKLAYAIEKSIKILM